MTQPTTDGAPTVAGILPPAITAAAPRTYLPIDEAYVAPELVWRVDLGARAAAAHLDLPVPAVVWIVPAPPGVVGLAPITFTARDGLELLGFADSRYPGQVWVRADRPGGLETSIHECRHLWQFRRWGGFADDDAREHDARQWTAQFMEQPITREEIQQWTR